MSNYLRIDNGTTWPDPRAGNDVIDRLGGPVGLGEEWTGEISKTDLYTLRAIVSAYSHLAEHPAGTESAIGSLRSLRRAVARRRGGEVSDAR